LLLEVCDEHIEIFLELKDFLIDFFGNLIFLGFVENVFFDLNIQLFDGFHLRIGLLLDVLDLREYLLDL